MLSPQDVPSVVSYSNYDMYLQSEGLMGEVFTILLASPHLIIPLQHAWVYVY